MCLDAKDLRISGNKFSNLSSKPVIKVKIPDELCNFNPYATQCVTDLQFDEDYIRHKVLVTITNQMIFELEDYESESPVKK